MSYKWELETLIYQLRDVRETLAIHERDPLADPWYTQKLRYEQEHALARIIAMHSGVALEVIRERHSRGSRYDRAVEKLNHIEMTLGAHGLPYREFRFDATKAA
jgi:hypothetical protein